MPPEAIAVFLSLNLNQESSDKIITVLVALDRLNSTIKAVDKLNAAQWQRIQTEAVMPLLSAILGVESPALRDDIEKAKERAKAVEALMGAIGGKIELPDRGGENYN